MQALKTRLERERTIAESWSGKLVWEAPGLLEVPGDNRRQSGDGVVGLALSRDGSHHPLESGLNSCTDLSCLSSLVILDMERVSRWETSAFLMLVM